MKTFFKVWNILIIAFWGVIGVILLLGILGIGSAVEGASSYDRAIGGAATLIGLLALIDPVLNITMGISGLRSRIDIATKIAYVLLVFNVINLFISDNKGMTVLSLVITIGYIFTAKKVDTYAMY